MRTFHWISRTATGIVLWVALLFLSSCGKSPQGDTETNPDEGTSPVAVMVLQPGSLDLTVETTGVIRSKYEIPITPEIAGRISGKDRDVGDAVHKGDVILRLDPEPYDLALLQAEASYRSAQTTCEQARRDYERAVQLRRSEDISQYELETAELAKRTAEATLQSAEAALKLAQRNARLTRITSPIDGVVAALKAQIGQQVVPGTPLGTVVSRDSLEIEVDVSDRFVVLIRRGDEVELTVTAYPQRSFTGRVRSVGSAGMNLAKSFPILIDVNNPNGLLMPGMIARVSILYERRRNALIIPRDALVLGAESPEVFIVQGKRAYSRGVELGPGQGERVIVESGLSAGDTLVVRGQNVLRDSVKVKII